MIAVVLHQRVKRWSVLIISFFVFLSATYLLTSNLIKKEGMPRADTTQLSLKVELPGGSVIEDTGAVVNKVHEAIGTKDYVGSYVASIGDGGNNQATMYLELVHKNERKLHSTEIEIDLAKDLKKIPNTSIVIISDEDAEQSASLVMRLIGKNLDDLKRVEGLIASTVLILILVPIFLYQLELFFDDSKYNAKVR